jgi:hypothetical protein
LDTVGSGGCPNPLSPYEAHFLIQAFAADGRRETKRKDTVKPSNW